ncbi:MAG TPA: hypothetical protein VFE65_09240 [Pseudonocardia sp.]|jgi:hypothetical protein|nr:hypothetical protein [Pseudonocardia sp.]
MSVPEPLRTSPDIRADLVAELKHFNAAVTRPNGMSFVGTVLAEEHQTPSLIGHFRDRLIPSAPSTRCRRPCSATGRPGRAMARPTWVIADDSSPDRARRHAPLMGPPPRTR